jgi:hypothetical protein
MFRRVRIYEKRFAQGAFDPQFTMSAADVIGEEQAWVTAMPEALRAPAQKLNATVVEPIMNK